MSLGSFHYLLSVSLNAIMLKGFQNSLTRYDLHTNGRDTLTDYSCTYCIYLCVFARIMLLNFTSEFARPLDPTHS